MAALPAKQPGPAAIGPAAQSHHSHSYDHTAQAEVMELSAPRACPAAGVVVEAQVDRGLGPLATVIVHRGELRVGDPVVVGTRSGKVGVAAAAAARRRGCGCGVALAARWARGCLLGRLAAPVLTAKAAGCR